MAPVPERPFTFSSLLRSQHLLLLLVLGLLTGTDNVPTLLSLAHFTNRLSRAESLFATAFHTHTTSDYGFYVANVASSMHNVIIIIVTLAPVPSSVFPPPRDHRVPGRAGGSTKGRWASGNGSPGLQTKQETMCVSLVLRPLLHTLTFTHSITTTISVNHLTSLDGLDYCNFIVVLVSAVVPSIVFTGNFHTFAFTSARSSARRSSRKIPLFPRSARTNLDRREWRKMSHLDSMGLTVPTLPIICPFPPLPRLWISIFGIELGHFMPFTSWISIFGYELCLSMPCLDWMSIGFALLAHHLPVESAFFIGLFTTLLSCVAATFTRQT